MDLTVGTHGGDITGASNMAIQAALDRVGTNGGGTVTLLPGTYTLWNSIRIPSHTSLIGCGENTALRKADGWDVPLWEDADWGDNWVVCAELPPAAIGHGVLVYSERSNDFLSTVGTVEEIAGNRLRISRRFNADTLVKDHARVASAFPLLAIEESAHVIIRDLVIDGNGAHNPHINGCRGGGVWGLFASDVHLSHVTVRHMHGDAISFQQCHDWLVEDCLVEENTGSGLHPGSGSQRPVIRRSVSRWNGEWGLFVCWRVKHGFFVQNTFAENAAGGISIGHKDTDNTFTGNQILRNSGPAILSRKETFQMAPHRCRYERNHLHGNNGGQAQIILHGDVHNLVFEKNTFDPPTPRYDIGAGAVHADIQDAD